MVALSEQGALVNRFQDQQPEMSAGLDLSTFIETRHSLIDLTEEGIKRGLQVLVGMGSVEELGGALRGTDSVTATLQNQKKRDKELKEAAKRRQLQELLDDLNAQIAAIDEQIDILEGKIDVLNETITQLQDGSMTVEEALADPDVSDAVKDWENRTGKKFDPNDPEAADILVAILASQVDEYGNDIAALKREKTDLLRHRDDVQAKMDVIKDARMSGASVADIQPELDAANETAAGAFYVTAEMQGDEEVVRLSEEAFDNDRDASLSAPEHSAESASGFAAFGAALSDASSDLNAQVETAFAKPREVEISSTLETRITLKI